jgi:hypothetical protein
MYDYMTERFILANLLQVPVYLREDEQVWGARRIEAVARPGLTFWVTDDQRLAHDGSLVRLLSVLPPGQRTAFPDLHWCVQIQGGSDLAVRQQAPDATVPSLRECLRQAVAYALHELEPLCPVI